MQGNSHGGRKPLRIAIIGCGWHSESAHARSLAHYAAHTPGEIALAAACDVDSDRAQRFCAEYGFARTYTEVDALLAGEALDGVVCVLPISTTREVGERLLRAGVPCAIEKPLGASLEEAVSLAEVARETKTPNMASLNRRFSPYLNKALEWAKSAGNLTYIRGRMHRNARREADFMWGTGIHVVDAMRYIGGDVATMEVRRLTPQSGSPPSYALSLKYACGTHGRVEMLPDVGVNEEGFDLFGEGFRASVVTIGAEGESVHCWRDGKLELEERADLNAPPFLRDGSYEETVAFIRSLQSGERLESTIEDALPSHELCHAAQNGGA